MTVLTSETRLLGTSVQLLPRVNLLPPEIAERRQFRRIQLALGSAVVASVGIVGLLVLSASHGVASAQGDLDTATQQKQVLQRQVLTYSDVTSVYSAAAAAQAQLTQAMGDEVRFSQLLNDLSLSVPSNVWLSNVAYIRTPPVATAAAAPVAPVAAGAATPRVAAPAAVLSPVGTFTVTGVAFAHDDVATWLESVAGLKTYVNPYFSTSTEALLGTRKIVNFSSTASLTSAALSGRYAKPAGG